MYLTGFEALEWIRNMNRDVSDTNLVDVALFPTFPALFEGRAAISKRNIGLGAQNIGFIERGALTGEISALSLKELGLTYAELGHHERRLYFNETDDRVRQKIELALSHGLKALVCVGEDQSRESDAPAFVSEQVGFLARDLALDNPADLIIAYEPRWAIGVDRPASPEHARYCCQAAREALIEALGPKGEMIRIIYGGSVREEDAKDMLALPSVNGLFIGRAALDTKSFAKVVNLAASQAAADLAERDKADRAKVARELG